MGGLGIGRGGHKDGVSWPGGIDAIEGLVVLGDDKHLIRTAGATDADEPIGEEGEVRSRDSSQEHCAVSRCGGEGGGLLEGVGAPRRRGRARCWAPGEEEGSEEENREEGEEVGECEEGVRAGGGGGGGGGGDGRERVARARRLLVRPLVERHCRTPESGVAFREVGSQDSGVWSSPTLDCAGRWYTGDLSGPCLLSSENPKNFKIFGTSNL